MTAESEWRATASIEVLRRRAAFMQRIRAFFSEQGVLAVETPVLSSVTATDVHLDSIDAGAGLPYSGAASYLLTSPEHAMKRLLACGSGPIYQITRAFRKGERGRLHNPEFAMLEWYRPGFDLQELQGELTSLLAFLGFNQSAQMLTYRQAFLKFAGIDPFFAGTESIIPMAADVGGMNGSELDRDSALDLLMTHLVEPQLHALGIVFITEYPVSQAALARVTENAEGVRVAQRFELYINGVEIANAYDELIDADEQRTRFAADNLRRKMLGKPEIPIDEALLQALRHMPESVGIAVGLDRLFMMLEGVENIQDVLSFPADRI